MWRSDSSREVSWTSSSRSRSSGGSPVRSTSSPPCGSIRPVRVPGTETGPGETSDGELRLVTYRPLFSGPAVERVPELEFQRPDPEVELARADAERLEIRNGQEVTVRSNGTSAKLRARLVDDLSAGSARIARDYAEGLIERVEITP